MRTHKLWFPALCLGLLIGSPAWAVLKVGDKAPLFTTQASTGGKPSAYSLADQLKKGPVVLYFYPKAFTKGCTIEAHMFADAVAKYAELGATVIGISNDDIDTLNKFSVQECHNKFPVGVDTSQSIMKSYDSVLAVKPEYANRTSYVIVPDGHIIYEYTNMSPEKHVENTLNAIKQWRASHPR